MARYRCLQRRRLLISLRIMPSKTTFFSSRWVYGIGVAVFLIYSVWILGPYLQSVFVRDASVTSWARVATAPIAGKIISDIPSVNSAIGTDGHLATIENDHVFKEANDVERAKDKIELTRTRVEYIEEFIVNMKQLEAQQREKRKRYAEMFRAELDSALQGLAHKLSVNAERANILDRMVQRQKTQPESNLASPTTLDELQLRLADVKSTRADLEARQALLKVRRDAAEKGVFIGGDGSDPAWAQVGNTDLAVQRHHAHSQLHEAKVELREARAALEIAKANLEHLSKAVVSIPPKAVLMSIEVPPGATVAAGDVIARWVDCSVLLVDVPVSDAELPLIKSGMKATVILEGEPKVRDAKVLLTRGSTATLDQHNLAALSKGRHEGVAQVLVQLDSSQMPDGTCPVGRAAYVEFPDVGLIDVIRARLRL